MDFNDNNFLNEINPLDLNSSIPATRDLKDSIHALAMLNGCTMQEYLEGSVAKSQKGHQFFKMILI